MRGRHAAAAAAPPAARTAPCIVLDDAEAGADARHRGDIRLGLAVNYAGLDVGVPSDAQGRVPAPHRHPRHHRRRQVHDGGRLVQQAQAAGMAVILLDVEGEYAFLHEPTDDARMLTALADRGLKPRGVPAEA